jgi:hypothetical protein
VSGENFVAYEMVMDAISCGRLAGFADVSDVIGRMTGLDMSRYDVVAADNLHGWHIQRRSQDRPEGARP